MEYICVSFYKQFMAFKHYKYLHLLLQKPKITLISCKSHKTTKQGSKFTAIYGLNDSHSNLKNEQNRPVTSHNLCMQLVHGFWFFDFVSDIPLLHIFQQEKQSNFWPSIAK